MIILTLFPPHQIHSSVWESTAGNISLLPALLVQLPLSWSHWTFRWVLCDLYVMRVCVCVCVCVSVCVGLCQCSVWQGGQTEYKSCQWTAALFALRGPISTACTDSLTAPPYQWHKQLFEWQALQLRGSLWPLARHKPGNDVHTFSLAPTQPSAQFPCSRTDDISLSFNPLQH